VERVLSDAAEALSAATRNAGRVSRLRQSILKWAFEGKLVGQDPTDEPASVLLERIKAEREKVMDANHKKPHGGRRKATA
jgi:type I restriction enzyme, S subunit